MVTLGNKICKISTTRTNRYTKPKTVFPDLSEFADLQAGGVGWERGKEMVPRKQQACVLTHVTLFA